MDTLRKIDPDLSSWTKAFIKAPMVFLLGFSGVLVGISLSSVKFSGEIIAAGEFTENAGTVIIMWMIAVFNSLFLVVSVNLSMKYYDQIDVMPTYFA